MKLTIARDIGIVSAVMLLLLLAASGCQTAINGGGKTTLDTNARDEFKVTVTRTASALTIQLDGKSAATTQQSATTQPSVNGPAGDVKNFSVKGTDDVGGLSFAGFQVNHNTLYLGLIFFALAAGAWFLIRDPLKTKERVLWTATFAALGILSFVWPDVLKWFAVIPIAVLAFYGYQHFKAKQTAERANKDIVKSVDVALSNPEIPSGVVDTIKSDMAGEQDKSTKAVVQEAKAEAINDSGA